MAEPNMGIAATWLNEKYILKPGILVMLEKPKLYLPYQLIFIHI
jgi:hypothetical protein